MIENYQTKPMGDGGTEERLMKYILPQFNIGSMYFNKTEFIELAKKLRDTPATRTFINNVFILTILPNITIPNTGKLETILFERRELKLKDLLISFQKFTE